MLREFFKAKLTDLKIKDSKSFNIKIYAIWYFKKVKIENILFFQHVR